MLVHTKLGCKCSGLVALIAALSITPVLAQDSNFESLSLPTATGATRGVLTGHTGGSFSLSSIANRDRHNNECFGFAAQTPDHVLSLKKDFSQLKFRVNSGGKGTTLVIKSVGDQTIRCAGDPKKDVRLEDSNWKAGDYQVWVGSIESGKRLDYTLTVKE